MSLAAWYSRQYSTWNTRRLHQTPFLARTDTNSSRMATAIAQSGQQDSAAKDNKPSEPLFGPNIGPCPLGPAWTTSASRKNLVTDDLTPDILSSWIEKSKQPSHPTTTLQALVNLKRPSLRLSPLSSSPEDEDEHEHEHHHPHGFEFEYDCDAPKCGIYITVILPKSHPEAASVPSASDDFAQILVFETVTPGGFGKRLTLEEGAVLELGRFDSFSAAAASAATTDAQLSSADPSSSSDGVATAVGSVTFNTSTTGGLANSNRPRKKFTQHFHFRKRSSLRSVSGPALAVVDADPSSSSSQGPPTPAQAQNGKKESSTGEEKKNAEEGGVRVMIRLVALDEQGTELAAPNEQTTFLHVVRVGGGGQQEHEHKDGEGAEAEDARPYVVKVVKREATIGPHTFQLQEIYGLTGHSSPSSVSHTYPPGNKPRTSAALSTAGADDDPSSECLLCLSSPREVVLIPCRHLVACKECAINMVEFGAGGNITTQYETGGTNAVPNPPSSTLSPESPSNGTGDGSDGGAGSASTPSPSPLPPVPSAPAPITTATTSRRKRKAKGWFCPVCRQPYTSLLRITAASPPAPAPATTDTLENGMSNLGIAGGASASASGSGAGSTSVSGPGSGYLSKPGFLRGGLSWKGTTAPATGTDAHGNADRDVEREAGLGTVGA